MNWQEKVEVYPGADAGAATLGTLAAAGEQLRMNTDVAWTNQPLQVWANNDVIQSVRGPHGGLYRMVSDADLLLWGGYSNQDALVSLSRADIAGEPDSHVIQIAATSNDWLYAAHVFVDANAASTGAAGSYNAQVQLSANNATKTIEIQSRIGTEVGAFINMLSIKAQSEAYNLRISDEDGVVTQFSPMVADGATAVAYLFDTSNAFANNSARLISGKVNGVEHVRVSRMGGIMVGPNAPAAWGSLPVDGDVFIAISNKALGDPNYMRMELATLNGAVSGNVEIMAFEGDSTLTLTKNAATQTQWLMATGHTTKFLSLTATVGATDRLLFQPQVADGATAVAYLFDTSNSLTNSAARLVSLKNNGVDRTIISPWGGVFRSYSQASLDLSGNYLEGVSFQSFTRADQSEPRGNKLYLFSTSDNWSFAAEGVLDTTAPVGGGGAGTYRSEFRLAAYNTASSTPRLLGITDTGEGGYFQIRSFTTQTNAYSLQILISGTARFQCTPTVADGAAAEAYLLDTANALSNAGARIVSFEIQGTRKASIDTGGAYFVGANQVVGARVVDARIDDAINSGDATTDGVIDACRDALIAHGLCTAA